MLKKSISILVALLLVVGMVPMNAMAEVGGTVTKVLPTFTDMPEDWSTEALENAVANGLLKGTDGKILPNEKLTRAEMATIMNRSFRSYEGVSLEDFEDMASDAWHYGEMSKAVQMNIFKGDGKRLNPNKPISREEAFAVMARAFKLDPSEESPRGYTDLSQVSTWAEGEVYSLIEAGYIKGSNGKIDPKSTITRAEFAQLMHNLIKEYISSPGVYQSTAKGNVMINVGDVTLKDLDIDGDLIIGEGVGTGEVVLDNTNISGRMVVRGGGEDSIIIKGNSKVNKVVISRVDGSVRVRTEGNAVIETVLINDGKNDVILEGTINNVDVQTKNVSLVLGDVDVKSMTISAAGADVKVEKNAKVKLILVRESEANISGPGKVEDVEVKKGSNDTVIEVPDAKIKVEKGATGTKGTGATAIKENTTVKNSSDKDKSPTTVTTTTSSGSSGGGGGGGGGSSSDDSGDDSSSGDDDYTPSKTVQEKLADEVRTKTQTVNANISDETAIVDFNTSTKTFTVTVKSGDKSIAELAGTGAMTILSDMSEITKYDNRDLTNMSKSEIKAAILADMNTKLNKPTTLGDLKDKNISVNISAKVDGVSFTDTYKFEFK